MADAVATIPPPRSDTGSDFTPADPEPRVISPNGGVERPGPTVIFTKDGKPTTDEIGKMLEFAQILVNLIINILMVNTALESIKLSDMGFRENLRLFQVQLKKCAKDPKKEAEFLLSCCSILVGKYNGGYSTFFGGNASREKCRLDIAVLLVKNSYSGLDMPINEVLVQLFPDGFLLNYWDFLEKSYSQKMQIIGGYVRKQISNDTGFKGTGYTEMPEDVDLQFKEHMKHIFESQDIFKMLLDEHLQGFEQFNKGLSVQNKELLNECRKLQMEKVNLLEKIDISTSRISELEGELKTSQSDREALLSQLEEDTRSPDAGVARAANSASAK